MAKDSDEQYLDTAIALAEQVRGTTSPNPWVGCVVVADDQHIFTGATAPSFGAHAEVSALRAAGDRARGATLYCTLEPCSHEGHNPACADAIVRAGIKRVVMAITDPDLRVNGRGIERLQNAGVQVEVGVRAEAVTRQLGAYLKHRSSGRPYVVLKMAMTMDGRIAAPDGTSKWITGSAAREDVHLLRSRCDAVIVGAGTVRADNPSLTVRIDGEPLERQPVRIVLGDIPEGANVLPALSWHGDLAALLDRLGADGCLQVLVEGGGKVAFDFHRAGLVDQYLFYVAPAILGSSAHPVLSGQGAETMADAWRGDLVDVTRFGDDIRMTVEPRQPGDGS